MVSIGSTIKTLRRAKGITQENLAGVLGVTYQSVSKYENETAQPDISLIPLIASYFGVSIDELFGYKLDALTDKEKFVKLMVNNQILNFTEDGQYYINTENFTTNALVAKIGEVLADYIYENILEFDTLMGLAYHGIAFSAAIGSALYSKYGMTINYCYDRKVADSRGRMICGCTPQDGERVVIVDDTLVSGQTLLERIDTLKKMADIQIAGVVVIVKRDNQFGKSGEEILMQEHGAKVYSIITDQDIQMVMKRGRVPGLSASLSEEAGRYSIENELVK